MRAFEFAPASSLSEVSELLTSDGQSARVIAGGTDLLGEIKEGVVGPRRLVSLQEIADLRSVRVYMDGVLIGGDGNYCGCRGAYSYTIQLRRACPGLRFGRYSSDSQCGNDRGQPVPASTLLVLSQPSV